MAKIPSLTLLILVGLTSRLLAVTNANTAQSASKAAFEGFFEAANDDFRQGKFDDAITHYTQALALDGQYPQVYFNTGMCHMNKQEYDKALECFEKAIALNPAYTRAYVQAGHAWQKKDKPNEAIEYYKKALARDYANAEAHLNIGRMYEHTSKFEDAIYHVKQALKADPKDPNALLELGNVYNMANKTEEALDTYEKLAVILPDNTSIIYNIGYTLKKLGRIEEAKVMYQKVLAAKPDHADAQFGLGLAYMLEGRFDLGWPLYESRWNRSGYAPRKFRAPTWDGKADLRGKTLFLHSEQGLGDTLQFIRYARVAKELGAHVVVAVQSALTTFIRECPYVDKVLSLQDNVPQCDYQIALMSMPLVLNTTVVTVPAAVPYLYADPILVDYWKDKLSHDKNIKIGICWQGNPNYATHFLRITVAAKSIPVNMFSPLADVPNISIYSLQRESGTEQLKSLTHSLDLHTFNEDFDKTHGRFMDTAAVIKNLDLVITIDTSIAHLAGGLGVPVWTFIPEPPDWRWMLNIPTTPWYPNMRLFRQPTCGDWESVIATIAQELKEFIKQKQEKR